MLRPKAVKVIPRNDYTLFVTFNNNEKKIFDIKPYLNLKPFQSLKNPAVWETVKPAGLSIEWINGVDICPDDLYYLSKNIIE